MNKILIDGETYRLDAKKAIECGCLKKDITLKTGDKYTSGKDIPPSFMLYYHQRNQCGVWLIGNPDVPGHLYVDLPRTTDEMINHIIACEWIKV